MAKINNEYFEVFLVTDHNKECIGLKNITIYETGVLDWSKSLMKYLQTIEDENIIFLQEDYFLQDFYNVGIFDLLEKGVVNNNEPCMYLNEYYVERRSDEDFRGCSLQAAVWHKSTFEELIGKFPNPWCFEVYGGYYCRKKRLKFSCTTSPMIDYTFTAVNRGKWSAEGIQYIKQYYPNFDFTKRGVFLGDRYVRDKLNLLRKLVNLRNDKVRISIKNALCVIFL